MSETLLDYLNSAPTSKTVVRQNPSGGPTRMVSAALHSGNMALMMISGANLARGVVRSGLAKRQKEIRRDVPHRVRREYEDKKGETWKHWHARPASAARQDSRIAARRKEHSRQRWIEDYGGGRPHPDTTPMGWRGR